METIIIKLPDRQWGQACSVSVESYEKYKSTKNEEDLYYHSDKNTVTVVQKNFEYYYQHNKLHRTNGPAYIRKSDSYPASYWYINNVRLDKQFEKWLDDNGIDQNDVSPEQEVLIMMKWGEIGTANFPAITMNGDTLILPEGFL